MTRRMSSPRRSRSHGTGALTSVIARRAARHRALGRELRPALRPAPGEDRPSATGTHPETESVRLLPLSVVRLERLLHGVASFDPGSSATPCAQCQRPRANREVYLPGIHRPPGAGSPSIDAPTTHCGKRSPQRRSAVAASTRPDGILRPIRRIPTLWKFLPRQQHRSFHTCGNVMWKARMAYVVARSQAPCVPAWTLSR
jgi:hypothetical protein